MARILPEVPRKEKTTTCRGCGHTVAYVENDIKVRNGTDYSGGPDGEEWINCPGCSYKIVLKAW
jgi:DNA-directed RNA polymerase subunit RPC12/RpoP